ncbi:hypothetical protein GMD78_17345 [Ornithinibacillus sp. L9]|uniref:Uncharacterized protein n=1 Tax=Ornithinibacillus caprae TaxID=2678566 RepID=A0A6N8FLV1_9BACI|nr:hypothetical protein [Ornithinibacillus caprae]MUK90141.1 hypothetical protein [Ornithinibacillus caprae]
MQRYIHIPFLFFTITAITGVWMRYFSFAPNTIIPYTNILHGHSHLAILGWAFLGVFIVFLYSAWNQITKPKQAVAILLTLTIISLVMFFAFIYQGYGVFSIVMSTLHIIAEYWTALFMYRQLKSQQVTSSSGVLFLKSSFVALFISSLGPYALGVISANGLKDHAVFDGNILLLALSI